MMCLDGHSGIHGTLSASSCSHLLAVHLFETFHCLEDVFSVAKGRSTHKPVTCGTEPTSWCGDNITLFKDFSEYIPGVSTWEPNPYIWCIVSTEHSESHVLEGFAENLGIFLVVRNEFIHLFPSFIFHACNTTCLGDYRGTIEDCGRNSNETLRDWGSIFELEFVRNNCPSESDTGESSVFGEGAGFNGTFLSSWDFKDAAWAVVILNEESICSIIDDD
mmetsp:Transcript_13634/g.27224  ORF Transcript_13634/g.27224 Transcript_13634/m.27224 type:complete len:219 (-) Transcript_13634:829-1485(-)